MKKNHSLAYILTISLLMSSCSGKGSDTAAQSSGTQSTPTSGDSRSNRHDSSGPASVAELEKIHDFALNSNLPLKSKSKLISAYISALEHKYNVSFSVSGSAIHHQIAQYFKIQSDVPSIHFQSNKQIRQTTTAVLGLRSKVAAESGLGLQLNGENFLTDLSSSQTVQMLRKNSLQSAILSQEEIRNDEIKQTRVLFKAIDSEAQKYADTIVASVTDAKLQDESHKRVIKSWKEISEEAQQARAVLVAQRIAKNTGSSTTEEQKKAMIPYLANSVLKYALDLKLEREGSKAEFKIDLSKTEVAHASEQLAQVCGDLASFAKGRSETLNGIKQELDAFTKDGIIKIDVSRVVNLDEINKFQASAAKIDEKVKHYTGDISTLINIAQKLHVDPAIVKTAQKAVEVAQTGEKFLAAFVSPTPSNIMSAVGSVFGGALGLGGPSADDIMNAKLDTIVNMEQIEIQQLQDISKGISAIQTEIANTQTLIGDLSKQIAYSSQTIYDELVNVQVGIQQIARLEQHEQRQVTGAAHCANLATALSHPEPFQAIDLGTLRLKSKLFPSEISPYLEGCYDFMSIVGPSLDSASQFLDVSSLSTDDFPRLTYTFLVRQWRQFNSNSSVHSPIPTMALNPMGNVMDLSSALAAASSQKLASAPAAESIFERTITNFDTSIGLLDSLLMARYTDLLIQVSPTVNLYEQFKTPNEEMGSNPLDVLNSMMQPNGTLYLKWLGNLMQLVNTNISQQVILSGISLADTPVAQILATNKLDPSKVDCRQLDETSFLYCALNRNADLFHNVLTYSFYNDLRHRTLPSVGYTYVTSLPHSTDAELDAMITVLKNSLSSPWPLTKGKLPDGTPWVFTQIANQPVPIPTGQELSQGIIQYRPELKYLLAARENLIDLMTEMRLNEVSDEDVKNQFALKVIKDAL